MPSVCLWFSSGTPVFLHHCNLEYENSTNCRIDFGYGNIFHLIFVYYYWSLIADFSAWPWPKTRKRNYFGSVWIWYAHWLQKICFFLLCLFNTYFTFLSSIDLFYQEIHLKIALCKIHSYVLWVMTSTCNDRCNTKRPIKVTGNIYKEHIRVIVVILYSVSYG